MKVLSAITTLFAAQAVAAQNRLSSCPDGVGNNTDMLEVDGLRPRINTQATHQRISEKLFGKRGSGEAMVPVSTQNNQCIDVSGGSAQSGRGVQLWQCTGGDNQKWRIEGPLFQTVNDQCLDLPNGWAYNGAKLQTWKCDGKNKNQHWSQVGSTLAYQGGSYCVDVTGGWFNDGNQLQLWTCYPGSANQAFKLGGLSQAGNAASGQGTGATKFYGYDCTSLDQFVNKYTACKPWRDALQAAASDQGLNPVFLGSIAMIESGCNPYPAGPNGRFGPFQFMDDRAWAFYGGNGKDKTNFWDAAYGAARYFKALLAQTNGNLYNAMRLYNGQVQDGGEPEYQNWAAGYMGGWK